MLKISVCIQGNACDLYSLQHSQRQSGENKQILSRTRVSITVWRSFFFFLVYNKPEVKFNRVITTQNATKNNSHAQNPTALQPSAFLVGIQRMLVTSQWGKSAGAPTTLTNILSNIFIQQ